MRPYRPLVAALVAALLPCISYALPSSGIDLSSFDHSVRIQDDFYQAVNGGWLKTTTIPSDQSAIGPFYQLRDINQQRIQSLIESAMQTSVPSAKQRKIADLHRSFTDTKSIETQVLKPLTADFQRIKAIDSTSQLIDYLGALQPTPVRSPIRINVAPDANAPDNSLLQLSQSGLGMPNRDYYLAKGPRFEQVRQAYRHYVQTLFSLAGFSAATGRAESVIALERELAKIQWDTVRSGDPIATNNPITQKQLYALSPQFPWSDFFSAAQLTQVATVNVVQPSYFEKLAQLINSTPLSTWRDYLRFQTLNGYAPFLNQSFVDASFNFQQKALMGISQPLSRSAIAAGLVEHVFGDEIGQLYVDRYFSPDSKQKVAQMLSNLKMALQHRIQSISWMTPDTRKAALNKLALMQVKVGYPDRWRDRTQFQIAPDDLIGNLKRFSTARYHDNMSKLGRLIDRSEWDVPPQKVNAFYTRLKNEIVIPAGILQTPFFKADADDAANYGS